MSQRREQLLAIRTNLRRPVNSALWNPINHVPRPATIPSPQPVTLADTVVFTGSSRDANPLLTVPERRRSRQQPSPTSLFVERSTCETESGRTSIAVPRQPRTSGSGTWDSIDMGDTNEVAGGNHFSSIGRDPRFLSDHQHDTPRRVNSRHSTRPQTFASIPSANGNQSNHRGAGASGGGDEEMSWGPAHPCYPHMNPHVPLRSQDYQNTRIIRIRRDWMIKGDLAPTFSNLYPEILDNFLPEPEFRKIIAKINNELIAAYNPYSLQNWLDATIGFLTGWIWDDIGAARIKYRLRAIEKWISNWNRDVGAAEGVKIWPLRSTGYLSLDIQIPDPKVGIVGTDEQSVHESDLNIHGARMDETHTVQITGPED